MIPTVAYTAPQLISKVRPLLRLGRGLRRPSRRLKRCLKSVVRGLVELQDGLEQLMKLQPARQAVSQLIEHIYIYSFIRSRKGSVRNDLRVVKIISTRIICISYLFSLKNNKKK